MKSFLIGSTAATLLVGLACAQPATAPGHSPGTGPAVSSPATGTTARPVPATGSSATAGTPTGTPGAAVPGASRADAGKAAASGDTNQAIATTSANADQPAKGANSFTEGEARRRIEAAGFSDVTGLAKDADGVWRGKARQKGGNTTEVWLDYKGNTGMKM